jgi:hypothetical protein
MPYFKAIINAKMLASGAGWERGATDGNYLHPSTALAEISPLHNRSPAREKKWGGTLLASVWRS